MSDSESARIKADVRRRRIEFAEFVKSGRKLIVIARPPQIVYVATGEVQTSGTGRNAARTRMVTALDIMSAIPAKAPTFIRASGDRFEVIGNGPIPDHFRKNASKLKYSATFTDAPGVIVAQVARTNRVVASLLKLESGGILALIPPATFASTWDEKTNTTVWPDEASAYQEELITAITSGVDDVEIDRPTWAERFATQQQITVRIAVTKQEVLVEKVRAKLVDLRATSNSVDLRDQLYLGTGRVLELRAKEVLELLGGVVSEPAPNRDDWRVDFAGTPAVVEIKGVGKSAAEKHAAQLEKWVAGAYADIGEVHKGILIVNTWRSTPLSERVGDDFPAQMIPYSTGRQHVLLTGLDLFVIAADIDADPKKAEYWKEKILHTSGRLMDVPDWRLFIQEVTTDD